MATPAIALLMGSKSDWPKVKPATDILRDFGVDFVARVMSAHRTPHEVVEFVTKQEQEGTKIFLAAAGAAAHLAGVVAAHTARPVIGIPVQGGALNGVDALLATVQMPGGIPVATFAIGSGGVKNAAIFAIQILALEDPGLRRQLDEFRQSQRQAVAAADRELQAELDAETTA